MCASSIVNVEEARKMLNALPYGRINMRNKMSAESVLQQLIYILEMNLTELASAAHKSEYMIGSWEADIECLEVISRWARAKRYGLDYSPEIKFNIYK